MYFIVIFSVVTIKFKKLQRILTDNKKLQYIPKNYKCNALKIEPVECSGGHFCSRHAKNWRGFTSIAGNGLKIQPINSLK